MGLARIQPRRRLSRFKGVIAPRTRLQYQELSPAGRQWFWSETVRRMRPNIVDTDTVVISYPRSGNHLLRFLLEYSFARPTLGAEDAHRFIPPVGLHDLPLHVDSPDLTVTSRDPIAVKRHNILPGDSFSQLILIVRPPMEAIISHRRATTIDDFSVGVDADLEWFAEIINAFWSTPEDSRLLVSYDEVSAGNPDVGDALVDFLRGGPAEATRMREAQQRQADALNLLPRKNKAVPVPYSRLLPQHAEVLRKRLTIRPELVARLKALGVPTNDR